MWYSKLASFFTHKNHLTSNQKPSFSNLWGFKSPPIYSKYGYNDHMQTVTHYNKYGGTKWYRKLLGKLSYYVPQRTYMYHLPRNFSSSRRWGIFKFHPSTLVISGALIVYTDFTEKIPYTKRIHIVVAPADWDKAYARVFFKRDELRILSEEHPDSVRVKMIGEQMVEALESDLKAMKSKNVSVDHLRGLEWEFVVVDMPLVGAYCVAGGKIVVYRGFLEQIESDAEIATVIGHEVARHTSNRCNKEWLVLCIREFFGLTLSKPTKVDDNPNGVSEWSKALFEYPGRRRKEMEADYIGLLVMASAGYDPQEAPKVYEMLGKFSATESDFYCTHHSGKKRAKNLAKTKVMEEASSIYSKAIETRKMKDLKDRWFWC